MSTACWYSEPFPPGGAIAAEGVRNQLGRPQLSLFGVLVREAVQNSWDARAEDSRVRFNVDARECSSVDQSAIASLLSENPPIEGLSLRQSLERSPFRLLVVSDGGTTGLGGPTRADIEPEGGGSRDFVAFTRNVGEPRDKELGAGTFGFGKIIFFLLSRARTVVAYTRCKTNGGRESRFIGCAIGGSFRLEQNGMLRPFTGRHWWGIPEDGVQEPLRNDDADQAAAVFGLKPFREGETGTSIVVLDPVLDDPYGDMRAIACAIAWHAWPKMVSDEAAMDFSVTWNGEQIEIPDPRQTPPLDAFVAALRRLREGEALECHRPQKLLGQLSLHRQIVRAHRPDYPASFEPPITSPIHHVALLRAPYFVVKYYGGDPLPGDAAEYAGVFVANQEIDQVFAEAETPTHDDWVARQLEDERRTFVNTTFTRLAERLRDYARPATVEIVGTGGIPLGAASAQFAGLVATAPSSGGTSGRGPTSNGGSSDDYEGGGGRGAAGGGRGPRGSVEEVGQPEYGTFDGVPALLFAFRVRRSPSDAYVEARTAVGIDDSLQVETEPPAGSLQPRVLGWLGPEGEVVHAQTLRVEGRVGQLWRVAVAPAPDAVTTLSLKLETPRA